LARVASSATGVTGTTASADDPAPLTPLRDAYEFNQDYNWYQPGGRGLPTHIRDLVKAYAADDDNTMRGKPVLAHGDNVPGTVRWQLDAGVQQDVSDGIITYTFATWKHGTGVSNNPVNFGQGQGYTPFTAEQQAAGRIAIQNWDDLITAKFIEIPAGTGAKVYGQNTADIVMANSYTGPAQAEAYYPGLTPYFGPTYQRVQGDVWVADPRINSSNLQFQPGQYGLDTLNHELGHSLGLTHPGSYNFGDDQDGDGVADPINYTGDAQYFQDSHQFTIMSYFDAYETGGSSIDWNVMRFIYPSTPMVDDVFVIQQKYGADTATRNTDTVYGFHASGVTNDAMVFESGELMSAFTIWDGGGTDTLDLSGYYTDSVIDLREGGYSSAGGWGAYSAATAALDLGSMDPLEALKIIDANNAATGLGPRTQAANFAYGKDYIYNLYINGGVQQLDAAGNPVVDENGDPVFLNEGLSWREITGASDDFLMENNIGIAYGAIIENAIGGHGDDRINGNQANNMFTGGEGADTFVIADYSGNVADATDKTDWSKVVVDTSVDTITDFNHDEGDKVDLASFGQGAVTNVLYAGTDLTFDANGHHYTVHVLGTGFNAATDIVYA
jgi:serralysin